MGEQGIEFSAENVWNTPETRPASGGVKGPLSARNRTQAVLYRGAGIEIVWPQLIAMVTIGSVFFTSALLRFRTSIASFSR